MSSNTIYFFRQTEKPWGIFSQWFQTPNTFFVGAKGLYSIPGVDEAVLDRNFRNRECFMMFSKAMLFAKGEYQEHNKQVGEEILVEESPREVKKLGRKVKGFDQKVWDDHKYKIVVNGNYLQFSQNKTLKEILLASKNKQIVEASPYDRIWGIGISAEEALQGEKWKGQNLLGKAIMEVREKLRS